MENQLVWNNRYNVGVDVIDKEHKKLFRILNKLFAFGQQETKRPWVCQETVKYFKDHALRHFQDEEEYMVSVGYTGLKTHMRIHKNFRETTLPALEKELELAGYSEEAVNHFLGVCAGWLIGHTLIEDQAIVSGEEVKQWENLLPEEEQAVMGQAIVSQLHSMFQLEPRMISNCYGGEKFGDGIYYRLIYSTREKKRWEFFLIFEERLIINTIGSVLETQSKAISVLLMNAARYTARQFVGHMKGFFPALEEAEVKEEQLLTYDQFEKVFEKHSPQYSLLFDTGEGYFAYCMTTIDMLPDKENGSSIMTQNAMAKVEKYLSQNKAEKTAAEKKKRILVVDDSNFMLKMLQKLLGEDYEVQTATSGLSAFRSIALNRPDLVLLDYEMPVCKGSQVLEMIRSEPEFADIPVIFLTGRVDRESVKKVLEFKPDGYLSKALTPDLIKEEIDRFFEGKTK
ncbi:MAG: response regulator [Lachnospiraceae bacterium]|jgi:hemerythrin-like metal-binding protein|nr:response regulator [Lachnospiraceae bacterium]